MIPKDAPTSAEPRVSSHGQNDKGSGSYGLTVRGRIGLALAALTLVTFWRAKDAEFINFDDSEYITSNPYVLQGLTLKSIGWAFSSGYACNWHPLTWFSHMMDVSLFGPSAGGPHMVNVLLHTANVVLLFFVLNRMTGSKWRSATVAALFAVHPLHVESVAWVSERKDVLSALFFMLTVMAYAKYVQSSTTTTGAIQTPTPKLQTSGKLQTPSSAADPLIKYSEARVRLRWYSVALLLFALGLMSKPMLVTLPFVLLLLDFWPLNRFRFETLG
ncbi:MAG TPA: hypothetical protein VLT36_03670, partial [Candidatus Dormibacteraeota bacterium]|nr:hypothetical protein [Candidatus Dormibacteraeota bacterium]